VAGHTAGHEELLAVGEIGDALARVRGIGPGPGRELVDEEIAGEDELFGSDLTGAMQR